MESINKVRPEVNKLFKLSNGDIRFNSIENTKRFNKLNEITREIIIKFAITFQVSYESAMNYAKHLQIENKSVEMSDDEIWSIIYAMHTLSFTFFEEDLKVVNFRSVIDNFFINKNLKEVRDINCFEEKYAQLKNEK